MTEEQKAAAVNARVACAMIRAMGMQAENAARILRGEPIAYTEEAFDRVIIEEGIHGNAIHRALY
jgi:hypothetical protein